MSRVVLAVLNISWTCTRHELRSYFSKFGKVSRIQIPISDNGFNQRVAFVKISGTEGFADTIVKDYHEIDGQEVTVNIRNATETYNYSITRKLN